jgi:hypothetical protein
MDTKLLQSALLFVIAAAALLNAFGTYRIAINLAESGNARHEIIVVGQVAVDGTVGVRDSVKVDMPPMAAPAPAPQ